MVFDTNCTNFNTTLKQVILVLISEIHYRQTIITPIKTPLEFS